MDTVEIKKELIKEFKNLQKSEKTKLNYIGHLIRVCKYTGLHLDEVGKLSSKNKILKFIKSKNSLSTKNQIVCALLTYMELVGETELRDYCKEAVRKSIQKRNSKKEIAKIKLTKELKWVEYSTLKMFYDISLQYVELTDKLKLKYTIQKPNQMYLDNLQLALFLGLYISDMKSNKPRRAEDWFMMKTTNKLMKCKKSEFNYLIMDKSKPVTFQFFNYKTFDKFGQQTYKINDRLSFLIKKQLDYYKPFKSRFLFPTNSGDHVSGPNFSTLISNVIEKFTGKKSISTNMLRNISITEIYKTIDILDINATAKDCGHDFKTACSTYISANKLNSKTEINIEKQH
jgi:hypothetical protein